MPSSVINLTILSLLAFGIMSPSANAAEKTARPNIVFFLVDDQRNDTLGCAGHPIIKTPNVDALAAAGIRFENAFVTTSICAASRASILTGLVERTHRYTFGTPPIASKFGEESYPAVLKRNGYRTGFIGKFGVSLSRDMIAKMFDSFQPHNRNPYHKKMPDGSTRHETQIAGDNAIQFIKSQTKQSPFCLSISFNAVHAEDGDKRPGIGHYPWPKIVDGMYEDLTLPEPRLSNPKVFESQPPFLKKSFNRVRYFWRWDTPDKFQTNMKAYYRMISGVDHVVGRVQKALKQQGLDQNTVIIYTGDNGYYMGQRGFAGKWSHYEESLRVPLIIDDPREPKSLSGRVLKPMVLNIDIPPTILNLADVKIPAQYQGRSLLPFIKGETPANWRQDFFCEHLMDNAGIPKWEGVRGKRYVYARYFENDFEFLHDLEADPDQLINFANDPNYAKVLKEMRKRCDELRDGYGGPFKAWPKPKKRKKLPRKNLQTRLILNHQRHSL
ncbi:sulfatase family protein [Gimesia aquarii]|uniref:Arylsulfatase n=1 Tax=Gimesia aquarii TaxID=2527964 RepID=A0A517W4F3_9PLAN|nr:sulfatase [Gimesia aquarii]QDU00129.1 Arylsulfatase [Gimesia aquarii]